MRDLIEILTEIGDTNDKFRTLKLSFISEQTEMLRTFSCCYGDLVDHKDFYKDQWLDSYNLHKGSNAAKKGFANSEVRELALIRLKMTAVKVQIDTLRTSISANKQR